MALSRRGRRPTGGESKVDLVADAIRRGCRTTQEVVEATGIAQPTPYFVRLEKRGIIRKTADVNHSRIDRRGRRVNQHGYAWEWVFGQGRLSAEEREYKDAVELEKWRRNEADEKLRALKAKADVAKLARISLMN